MVVKMMKWSPWPAMATRKFKVKVKPMRLEGFINGCDSCKAGADDEKKERVVAIKMRWKGEPKFGLVPIPRTFKQRRDFSREKIVKEGKAAIGWDDDEFENICSFTTVSGNDQKFGPWDISFSLLYGERSESKAKLGVIGRVSMNIAEMASKMDLDSQIERKLPINFHIGGVSGEANLVVMLAIVEVRDSQDSAEMRLDNSDESHEPSTSGKENAAETMSITELESVKKTKLFSWKRRRLSFIPYMIKGDPSDKNTRTSKNDNKNEFDSQCSGSTTVDSVSSRSQKKKEEDQAMYESECQDEGSWESKEVTSRDGETKLKTNVFFASFDQRSNKAAGESACTALVAVVAHWLQLNRNAMPTRSEFNDLIVEGSSEWRKLCDNDAYTNDFPDKHFDLETVLHADVRPLAICRDDSFVGFFSPEKFESLKEAMSFDEIWSGINRSTGHHDQRIYVVSWNDHFFVLKAEADAYYIIDTLGERLYEGCNQAYILKFDDSSLMYRRTTQEEGDKAEISGTKKTNANADDEKVVCSGKECCKEFIKRFLAAIPLRELETEERKGAVPYYSLHNRLQIELNSSYLLSSSLTSSPFSSSSNSASSCSMDD